MSRGEIGPAGLLYKGVTSEEFETRWHTETISGQVINTKPLGLKILRNSEKLYQPRVHINAQYCVKNR